jgi:beta-mannosidase
MKTRYDLGVRVWELARSPVHERGPDWGDAIPAQVPGSLLIDLYRAELVPDPYFGENFRACQWAGEWTFWYRTWFTADEVPGLSREGDRLVLHFETVDTFGEVFLNGHALGRTDNMFVRYDFDVTSTVVWDGVNELVVRIDPPKAALQAWLRAHTVDRTGVSSLFDADRPFIRKSQMTFGWDNCPYLVSGGIPRPVWLEVRQGAWLEDVAWTVSDVDAETGGATLTMTGSVEGRFDDRTRVAVHASCEGEGHAFEADGAVAPDGAWAVVARVEGAKLWWPNGVGHPHLYDVTVELDAPGGILDSASLQIGLREFKVITEPAERRWVDYRIGRPEAATGDLIMDGADIGPWRRVPLDEPVEVEVRTFRLEVNGRRVFIKGLDWQNPDVLVGNETPAQVQRLVDGAADAHMNMLRVWGGGAVELDAFFERCSQRGIMVWHDFFYACALYPRDDAFLERAGTEAADIVQRLRNHTCLAMWCGDNESDMILYDRGQDPDAYLLNKIVLRDAVATFDLQRRHYHPSSPSGGPYPRSDWGGDKRNWGPWFPHSNYRHIRQESARVISESGSKSLPAVETVRRAMPADRQWPLDNRTWQLHAGDLDNHVRGDYLKFEACMRFFPEPRSLEEAVETSQFATAWGVKLLIERCRQQKGACGGILVWKNADQWPSLDHGFYDYYGHPRAVYAWSKLAFVPVAISITQHFEDPCADLEVWLVNDLVAPVAGQVTLSALTIDAQGRQVSTTVLAAQPARIGPDDACCVFTYPVKGFDPARTVFVAVFVSQDGATTHEATYTLAPETAYVYHILGSRDVPDAGAASSPDTY